MTILPISNIINVSILQTPSGFAERNVNTIALFTTEEANFIDIYRDYISVSQVVEDFGSGSITTQMAQAIFSQAPNIRAGQGQLVIVPFGGVSATQGRFVTANISANLNNILNVEDGRIRITIDGVNNDLENLNFTNATTLSEVATILQQKVPNAIITATTTAITFKAKSLGATSILNVGVLSGSGTNLAGSGYFNTAGGTKTDGANASGETLAQAINRVSDVVFFAGVITDLEMQPQIIKDTANFIQALDKIFIHHFASTSSIAGVITDIKDAGLTKTRCLFYSDSPQKANLYKSAYVGRAFSVNFNGSNTSQTMNLKQLAGITPDANINQTLYNQCNTAGADIYVSYEGVPSVYSTGGNDYFDNVYNDLALKFSIEASGFNFLRQTNTKVPQTETGMNGLKNAYKQVIERFRRVGVIAEGSWTSSETFGNQGLFLQSILNDGYYIYSEPITQQNSTQREQRKAPLVQIAIKRAGAIHTSDVIININN